MNPRIAVTALFLVLAICDLAIAEKLVEGVSASKCRKHTNILGCFGCCNEILGTEFGKSEIQYARSKDTTWEVPVGCECSKLVCGTSTGSEKACKSCCTKKNKKYEGEYEVRDGKKYCKCEKIYN